MADQDSAAVEALIEATTPAVRQRDARTLLAMLARITGESPRTDRGMIGFGHYHYRYESGREGDTAAAGFAPRKAAMSIYLMDGIGAHTEALSRLGKHTSGVGCLYVKNFDQIDLEVLEQILTQSCASLTSTDTWTARARDGGRDT